MKNQAKIRIAADIGGTFTDVAAFDEKRGVLMLGKTLTTPQRLVSGILDGMRKAGVTLADAKLFLHGSTVAINTMLERSGARAALITTRGFRDIYEIGRITRRSRRLGAPGPGHGRGERDRRPARTPEN